VIAETEILCSLADIKGNCCVALAGITAVKLDNAILELQTAKGRRERLFIEHHHVQPPIHDLTFRRTSELQRVRTFRLERSSHAGVVLDFHQELTPALLDQFWCSHPSGYFHPRFRVDLNEQQTKGIEQLL